MPNNAQHTTIQLDTALVREWQQSGDYNYFDEEIQKDSVELNYRDTPQVSLTPISPQVVFFIVIILFLVVSYFAMKYKRFSGFFMKEKSKNVEKKKTDEESETNEEELQEELFRLDLPKLISDALAEKKFDTALKFTYMQAFRRLCEAGILTWKNDTTPSEYAEQPTGDIAEPFKRLTIAYINSQYGHFSVTEANYASASADLEELEKQVKAVEEERLREQQEDETAVFEKGGEA